MHWFQTRTVSGAIERLQDMLQWTGIVPDEGPSQGGNYGPYIQSQRLELYRENIKTLLQNETSYYCFCTPLRLDLLRRDAARNREVPGYDNRCRHLTKDEVQEKLARKTPYVIRLKLEPTTDPWDDLIKGPVTSNVAEIEGDPVLLKSDGFPTYHFANVVDDHYMEVTHVLRGDEWRASTPKHLLLYKAFGWHPPQFGHLPLILNKDGTKLSKRQGDIHVEHFRNSRYLPEAVVSYVTTVGSGFGVDTSSMTLEQLVQQFKLEKVRRNNSRLDPLFLEESNKAHLKRLLHSSKRNDLVSSLHSIVAEAYTNRLDRLHQDALSVEYLMRILDWSMTEDRICKLTDLLLPSFAFLWEIPQHSLLQSLQAQHPHIVQALGLCTQRLQEIPDFEKDTVSQVLKRSAKESQIKFNVYMLLLRQVLSGLKEGPPVAEMMTLLGRQNTLRRIEYSIKLMTSCQAVPFAV
ncbi:hypothetical protein C0Q70_21481 [Pomacea canaliculata]|uniref:Uncharacterized protein n=1 Tax=Pomacea canaliculata TaxID=400727 RepID=A0A2T7NCR0_POMCA|nr:hypothetical protein C0Q70_21481 [Pomacea canaliculata]